MSIQIGTYPVPVQIHVRLDDELVTLAETDIHVPIEGRVAGEGDSTAISALVPEGAVAHATATALRAIADELDNDTKEIR